MIAEHQTLRERSVDHAFARKFGISLSELMRALRREIELFQPTMLLWHVIAKNQQLLGALVDGVVNLRRYAKPLDFDQLTTPPTNSPEHHILHMLLSTRTSDNTLAFSTHTGVILCLTAGDEIRSAHFEDGVTLQPVTKTHIIDALILSWQRDNPSSANNVRDFLCKRLIEFTMQENKNLAYEFSLACAAHPSGKQLCTADYVIMHDEESAYNFRPASEFTQTKITLDDNVFRRSAPYAFDRPALVSMISGETWRRAYGTNQVLFQTCNATYFITTPRPLLQPE